MINNNMDNIINQASKKFGVDSNELKKNIENGKLDNIINNLPPAQAAMMKQALNNPMIAQQLLNTPQAQNIIKQFVNK